MGGMVIHTKKDCLSLSIFKQYESDPNTVSECKRKIICQPDCFVSFIIIKFKYIWHYPDRFATWDSLRRRGSGLKKCSVSRVWSYCRAQDLQRKFFRQRKSRSACQDRRQARRRQIGNNLPAQRVDPHGLVDVLEWLLAHILEGEGEIEFVAN